MSSQESCYDNKCYKNSQERVLDANGQTQIINFDSMRRCTDAGCTNEVSYSSGGYLCDNGSCAHSTSEVRDTYVCSDGVCSNTRKNIVNYPHSRSYTCDEGLCTENGGAFANYDTEGKITDATNSHTCDSRGCYPAYYYDEYSYENGNITETVSRCTDAVCTTNSKKVETPEGEIYLYECDATNCRMSAKSKCIKHNNDGVCSGWKTPVEFCETNCTDALPATTAGESKTVIHAPDVIAATEAFSEDDCPTGFIKKDNSCVYGEDEHKVVCAYGYIDGCTAGVVTLADGSKVLMKNGQIVNEDDDNQSGQDNNNQNEYPMIRKHWTPAEAAEVVGENNAVILYYK